MEVHLTLTGSTTRTSQIYRQLLASIQDGRLVPGARLPAARELAAQLRVARGTVTTAYERLAAEGFVAARPGSGVYVSARVRPQRGRRATNGRPIAPQPAWRGLPPPVDDAPPRAYDLSIGGPDTGLFPLAVWRRMVSAALRPALVSAEVYAGGGHPELRVEIARYLGLSRSVRCSVDDVLLTTGAQQGIDLVARVLLRPGDTVAVEDPGYTAAVRLFASHGARVHGVPVDDDGLRVDLIPREAKIVYVTPSHQFPLGAVLSLPRRLALLEWAERRAAVIVEDDYDSEFRFDGRPLDPLHCIDHSGRVIYVGSFSKILLPLLRVGYLVAPSSLQDVLRQAKMLTDWQGDLVTQGALARFMAEGLLAGHLRRTARIYRERRARLQDALAAVDAVQVLPSVAGLHLATRLRDPSASDRDLVRRLAAVGVSVEALSPRYLTEAPRPGLLMGFRHITADRIPEAVRRVAAVLATAGGHRSYHP